MVIDVHKKKDVAVVDIPGAFLTTDMDKGIIMLLLGRLAELKVNTEPSIYQKFFMIENGWTVLYVKLQKVLYQFLRSALLFFEKLVSDLNSIGFIINPLNTCISNMMAYGNKMTVTWQVDDLKILYVDADEMTKVIYWMK